MWSYNEDKNVAYKIVGKTILLTSSICFNSKGEVEVYGDVDDDMEVFHFKINEDGSLSFSDWIDLRQFNNSQSFLSIISTLNDIIAFKTGILYPLSIEEEIKKDPIFTTSNIHRGWKQKELYDLSATIKIQNKSYGLQKQFVKYTFIDSSICEKSWTVGELFNLYVHLQKFLYEEEFLSGDDNFLQVDSVVKDVLSGSLKK